MGAVMFSRRHMLAAVACASMALAGCGMNRRERENEKEITSSFEVVSPFPGARFGCMPDGEVEGKAQLSRSTPGQKATTTNLVLESGALYVGGNVRIRKIDAKTGEGIHHHDFTSHRLGAGRIALVGDVLLVAFGDGSLAALDRESFDLLWEKDLGLPLAEWGRQESSTGELSLSLAPAFWYVADIAVSENLAFVGFSSYQVDPGSHLLCIDAPTGTVVWTKTYPGRFCYSWGVAHPCLTPGGLLVARPEEGGIETLAIDTGDTRCAVATGWIGMGFTPVPETRSDYVCVSMYGELYRLRIDEAGDISLELICGLSSNQKTGLLPSSAQPVMVGSKVLCNAPVPVIYDGAGRARPHDSQGHSVVIVDLESASIVSRKDGLSFDGTPVVVLDRESGDHQVLYLQDSGLWRCLVDDGGLGNATRLNDQVPCGTDTPRGPFAITEEGHVLIAGGTTEVRYLYRVS